MQINTKETIVKTYTAMLPNGKEIAAKTQESLEKKIEEELKKIEETARLEPLARAIDPYFPYISIEYYSLSDNIIGYPTELVEIIEKAVNKLSVSLDIVEEDFDVNEHNQQNAFVNICHEFEILFTNYTPLEKIKEMILKYVLEDVGCYRRVKPPEDYKNLRLKHVIDPLSIYQFEKLSPKTKEIANDLNVWFYSTEFLNPLEKVVIAEFDKFKKIKEAPKLPFGTVAVKSNKNRKKGK